MSQSTEAHDHPSRPRPAIHALQGFLMGSADVVPGVSGGTVALVVGIYEQLLSSIHSLASAATALMRLDATAARERFWEVSWLLVLPLGAGIGAAILTGARVIPPLIEAHPEQMSALFFGLIVASLIVPWRRLRTRGRAQLAIGALAAVAAFGLTGLPEREVADPALPVVFVAASIAICAMILPGVSGSFLLLAMGLYAPTLDAIDTRDLAYVGVFMAGAAIGLGAFSKLLVWLLRHYHDLTMAVLLGAMVGALRALWPYSDEGRAIEAPPLELAALGVLAFALVGFALVRGLIAFGDRRTTHP